MSTYVHGFDPVVIRRALSKHVHVSGVLAFFLGGVAVVQCSNVLLITAEAITGILFGFVELCIATQFAVAVVVFTGKTQCGTKPGPVYAASR